jgi:hypothetical protein
MADKTSLPNLQFINVATKDKPVIRVLQDSLIGSGNVKLENPITDKDGNAPTLEMMLTFKNTEGKYMQATVPAGGFTDSTTITGMKRGIAKSGIDLETEVAALDINLQQGTEVVSAIPAQLFQLAYDALRGQIGSSIKHNVAEQYENGIPARIPVYADVATGEAAISSPVNGDRFYATTEGVVREYIGGAWGNSTGVATPNASTTVSGKGEVATSAESKAGTDTGGTGAKLWVLPSDIAKNIQDAVYSYAADAEASDTYAITLTPAVATYAEGQVFFFKANTANTGAATLNVNALGAKTIKKLHDQDLEDNDIEAGQMVMVMYDGTNFQMFSPLGTQLTTSDKDILVGGPTSDGDSKHTHNIIKKLEGVGTPLIHKEYFNFHLHWLLTTNIPSGEWWTNSGYTVGTGNLYGFSLASAGGASVISTNNILLGDSSKVNFSRTKILICEFEAEFDQALTANEGGFGFVSGTTVLGDSDDQTQDAACFTYDGTNIYGHTADGGVGQTNTALDLTGITITDWNRYRIEFDPTAGEVRFYINGVLKATNTTNLPNASGIKFGAGQNGGGNGKPTRISNIYISEET